MRGKYWWREAEISPARKPHNAHPSKAEWGKLAPANWNDETKEKGRLNMHEALRERNAADWLE